LKHQHYIISDARNLINQSISVLNNAKYRFTNYSSHTEVNTVNLLLFAVFLMSIITYGQTSNATENSVPTKQLFKK